MSQHENESFGVLVGWAHHPVGSGIDLTLQCAQSTRRAEKGEVDDHHIVMTREQAAVLANYLFRISGHTPPKPRGLLSRWFG